MAPASANFVTATVSRRESARFSRRKAIFLKDPAGLDWADGVVAIMDVADPDSGTCWECGYAYATKKPVVLFRSDFRSSGDAAEIPYNMMLIILSSATLLGLDGRGAIRNAGFVHPQRPITVNLAPARDPASDSA
jgi:nucleoside 2-deoxyribosyltransferase